MIKEQWLSRDSLNIGGWYNIHDGEPEPPTDEGMFCGENVVETFDPKTFHKVFSVRLRKGRKRKIKRILIELED